MGHQHPPRIPFDDLVRLAQYLGAWHDEGPHDTTGHRGALRARIVAQLIHLDPCQRVALAIHALDAPLVAHTTMAVESAANLRVGQHVARALDRLSNRIAPIRDAPAFLRAAYHGHFHPRELRRALVVALGWSQALHHGAQGVVDLLDIPDQHGLQKAVDIRFGLRSLQQRWAGDPVVACALLEGLVLVAQPLSQEFVLFIVQEQIAQHPPTLLAMLALGLQPPAMLSPMIEQALPQFHEPPSAHRRMHRACWKGRVAEAMALDNEEALAVLRAW